MWPVQVLPPLSGCLRWRRPSGCLCHLWNPPCSETLTRANCSTSGVTWVFLAIAQCSDSPRPVEDTIGYFSTLIPHTMLGQVPYLMLLDCAEWAIKTVEPLIGYSAIVLHTLHKFLQLLTNTFIKTISQQHCARWETALLSTHITVEADTCYNPTWCHLPGKAQQGALASLMPCICAWV